MPSTKPLLRRFPFLDTTDIYTVRKKQGEVWGKYSSKVIDGKKYHLLHNRAELPHSAIDFIDCSAGVSAHFSDRHDWHWLLLPLTGHLELTINGQEFCADSSRAILQVPWEQYRFRATPARAIFFGLDSVLANKALPEDCRGCLAYTLEGPYRNVLKQLLIGLAEALDDWATGPVGRKQHPGFLKHLEASIASCISEGVRDSLSGGYGGGRIGTMPITAIRTFMDDNLAADLSIQDIADAAGVSIRTLQSGFADHYFLSPKQMLKVMRLDKARKLLKSRKGPDSVGDVCKLVGHGHAGRFSKEYAERFGESPSKTLRERAGEA